MKRFLRLRFWLRLLLWSSLTIITLFLILLAVIYKNQDWVVQQLLDDLNKGHQGEITLKDSHISPFANFPYISIDLEEVKIYENKEHDSKVIFDVHDIYLGFDIWTIISGKYETKSIRMKDGFINLVQHKDGSFNIANALLPLDTTVTEEESPEELFHLDLKSIKLTNVDIHKFNEMTNTDVEAFVNKAKLRFKMKGNHTYVQMDSKFELNLMQDGDTTFIKHKHFDVHTTLDYDGDQAALKISPSKVKLEMGEFNIEGNLSLKDDMPVDLLVHGAKPNFDLLIAFAPEDLIPTLKSYDNKGKVFFEASVKGPTAGGGMPAIRADFGCEDAFFKNNNTRKTLDDMSFNGYFTNGEKRDFESMEFVMNNFSAKPDVGIFSGNLKVRNFLSPDINLQLKSEFNLEFLADFFNLDNLEEMDGFIALTMNFHDIIDLNHPEKSIEKLNESYFTELEVRDLNVQSSAYPLPIKNLNIKATMEGHEAIIKEFKGELGKSDVSITGSISDLPAILHHTNDSIQTELSIQSKLLDLAELTYNDSTKTSSVDEQIKDFRLELAFLSSARAFTESPNLPVGEFFIRDLHASLQHYPHELHDFHADLFIEDENIRLVDFSGEVDSSDFHFSGSMTHYETFLKPIANGEAKVEFDLTSKFLRLEDLFAYKGENYVPKDYRHEEFDDLKLHGHADLHFINGNLHDVDMWLDELSATMKVHQCRFDKFTGDMRYVDEHFFIESLKGQIGRSDLDLACTFYTGKDPALQKKDNFCRLAADKLDVDQLIAYNPPPTDAEITPADHEDVFNIFDVPFMDIALQLDVKDLKYHKYQIYNLQTGIRMQKNHYIYVDSCDLDVAGGHFDVKGYFNGSNPDEIYFSPDIYVEDADIDRLMLKFENFGQDHLVSENLHGKISCGLTGKIRMHADMVPIIDQSDLKIDLEVVNGRLENYKPIEYVASYFKDKNLAMIRFDTLKNELEFKDNTLYIPHMEINSSLGFIELWGQQDMDFNMDFYFRVPWKLIGRAAFQKLFKRKKEEVDPDQLDEIEYRDPEKKVAFVSVNMKGNMEDYKISLKKDKKKRKRWRLLRKKRRKSK
jgi:hypothetical protein